MAAVDEHIGSVCRWGFAWDTTLAYRCEPLLHERLWLYRGREMQEEEAVATRHGRRVGYDRHGRIVVCGPARHPVAAWGRYDEECARRDGYAKTGFRAWPGGPMDVDLVSYHDGATEVVTNHGSTIVTTEHDADGNPISTTYSGDQPGFERYEYADGVLVGIDQQGHGIDTDLGGYAPYWLEDGRLSVEPSSGGPVRVVTEAGHAVWERCSEDCESLLARGAQQIADQAITAVADSPVSPDASVFALSLVYVNQGSLFPTVLLGLEEDRRRWKDECDDVAEVELRLWYPEFSVELDYGAWDQDLDALLLREIALNQPLDPYRVVLGQSAARLARHDWTGVQQCTDEFVVFIAEHDEGIRLKYESLVASNPAERLAAWQANWPAGASLGEDELQFPWVREP